jgi:type II secretory pathway pseudopilin PulG
MLNLQKIGKFEILIVILLLVVLFGLSIKRFFDAQIYMKLSQVYKDMNELHQAFESYYIDNRSYPPDNCSNPYYLLTSPNSYIQDIPKDIFRNQNNSQYLPDSTFYDYLTKGDKSSFINPYDWIIISFGPDEKEDIFLDYGYNDVYNVSNGIFSNGDIFTTKNLIYKPY